MMRHSRDLMLAFSRRLWSSTHLKDALFECPFLLLFTIPWTAAALLAFLYVQSSLLISLIWTKSVWELLFNGIGFLLCFPWLLLSLKSAVGTVSSFKAILRNGGGFVQFISGVRRLLEQWVPRKRGESAKMVFVLIVWLVASSPFSILIGQFIDDSRITLAVVLALLLMPYWLLAIAGICLLVMKCTTKPVELHEQIELISRN